MTILKLGTLKVGGKRLLNSSDFTLEGHYILNSSLGSDIRFGGPITHRYIDGELRFLIIEHAGYANNVIEFKLPAGSFGQTVTDSHKTNSWSGSDVWAKSLPWSNDYLKSLTWEDQGNGNDGVGRLWSTQGINYPQNPNDNGMTQAISVRTLNSNGTVSNSAGLWGFEGVSQRCIYGNMIKNPQWFQDRYNLGPYLYTGGGGASLVIQGGLCSLGSFFISGPDPTSYPQTPAYGTTFWADANIPETDFKILADHRSGTDADDSGMPTTQDRGARATNPINFFDDDDPNRPFPLFDGTWYATHMPSPNAKWLSPASDGFGRFVWGDSYFSTQVWIDGPNKHGIVSVGSLMGGWAGYLNSTLQAAYGEAEIHIFNPSDLGAVANGDKNPWNVQPSSVKIITADMNEVGICTQLWTGLGINSVTGATFDLVSKRLWILSLQCDDTHGGGATCVLSCYSVNC